MTPGAEPSSRGDLSLRIVPAKEADRAFFVATHHAAYRATVEQMFPWDAAQQDALVGAKFDLPGTQALYQAEQRVGVVGLQGEEGHILLRDFFVLPEFQNRGIGSLVILQVKGRAQRLEQDIRLRTLRANAGAKQFYERHGFRLSGEGPLHWFMIWERRSACGEL